MPSPETPAESHPPDWLSFPPGTQLTVVKLAPDGSETTRYDGHVVAEHVPAPWLAVGATWISGSVHLNGLDFLPGDTLLEYFSPAHWFNAFAVYGPDGVHRGWYANVTYPATLDPRTDPPTLTWHDLFIDIVLLPTGEMTIRDEEELETAGVVRSDPKLHATVLEAEAELIRRAQARLFPFHDARGG